MILNLLNKKIMIILVKPMKLNKVIKRYFPGGKGVITPISNLRELYNIIKTQKTLSLYQKPVHLQTSLIGINNVIKSSTILTKPFSRTPYKPQSSLSKTNQDQYIRSMADLLDKKALLDEAITLKNINNKEYETKLTPFTRKQHLTDNQVIHELKIRGLVKDDDGNTTTNITLQDGSLHTVGSSKNNIKLSTVGQAYVEWKKTLNLSEDFLPPLNLSDDNIKDIIIVVPPQSDSSLLIETGKQKHLLVAIDNQGNYYSFGYLTSKKNAIKISDKQFKTFQKEQEQKDDNTENKKQDFKNKTQGILFFEKAQKIEFSELKVVKWGDEYINTLAEEVFNIIKTTILERSKNPVEHFDNKGISKEVCIEICQQYDAIAITKGTKKEKQHPISADQLKQNTSNTDIQKQNNKNKTYNNNENSLKND